MIMTNNTTNNMNTVADLLERIAKALESRMQPVLSEGFFDYGKKVFCNVVQGNGDGWYTLQDGTATTQLPICRGKVVAIRFPTVERRNQEVRKFHLVMTVAEGTITFESGYDCFFSKTILSALAIATPELLAQPIQLASYTKHLNTGDTTLAVSIRDSHGNRLSCDWSNGDDWKSIAAVAMENVDAAVALR